MRCVECGAPAGATFRHYANGTVKLVKCNACGAFVDGYVEYELTIIILDMVLYKRQAYRHLIFNYLPEAPRSKITGLPKPFDFLLILFILLDAYIHLLSQHCTQETLPSLQLKFTRNILAAQWNQFLWVTFITAASYFVHLLGVFGVVYAFRALRRMKSKATNGARGTPKPSASKAGPTAAASPSREVIDPAQIASTLLLSSYGKLLLILLLVWEYPAYFTILADCIVVSSQLLGLRICLSLDPLRALLAVGIGIGLSGALRTWLWHETPMPCMVPG